MERQEALMLLVGFGLGVQSEPFLFQQIIKLDKQFVGFARVLLFLNAAAKKVHLRSFLWGHGKDYLARMVYAIQDAKRGK